MSAKRFAREGRSLMRTLCWFSVLLFGCSTTPASPGMTLLVGLNYYRDEMARLEQRPEKWPDRQELRNWLKMEYGVFIGRSAEFGRLVDLDVKKREYVLTLREPSLKADRAREIKAELVKIDKEIEGLKDSVKAHVASAELRVPREQHIEAVAAIGLFTLALGQFSAAHTPAQPTAPSISVGNSYTVTERGNFALVAAPQGQTYRCFPIFVEGPAAGIKCEPVAGKP